MTESPTPRASLMAGALAALAASACCLGPLALLTLGFSGAWISNLTQLEPYQPLFLGVAGIALLLAWRRIWRNPASCRVGEVCARPRVNAAYKALFGIVALLILLALVFPLLAPLFY